MTAVPREYRYGECRLLGHSWHIVPSDWTPSFGVPMTARCERCNLERREIVQRNTGEVASRRYVYPEGYLFGRDPDALPGEPLRRVDFRLAWLDDQIVQMKQRQQRQRRRRSA